MGDTVVIPAEQSQIAGLGVAAVGPMLDVMDIAPARVSVATLPRAVSVPDDEAPSQGGWNDPGASTHVDDLAVWAEHDPAQRAVAGEGSQFGDREDMSVLGLVETSGDSLQGKQVTDGVDVWLLPTDGRSVAAVEVVGEILEGVVTALPGRPGVAGCRRRHEGVEGGKGCFAGECGHPTVETDHPPEAS